MLKLLILAVMVLCTAGIGRSAARQLARQAEQLDAMVKLITEIEIKLRFQRTPLPSLLRQLSQNAQYDALGFLPYLCEAAGSPDCIHNFDHHTDIIAKYLIVRPADRRNIESFFHELGALDLEGTLKSCDLHKNILSGSLVEARTTAKEKGRLYVSLGLLAGLSIAVFFA